MCTGHSQIAQLRRRSVDVGGLALALGLQGLGHGWGGWDSDETGEAMWAWAEGMSDMWRQTHNYTSGDYSQDQTPRHPIPADVRLKLINLLDSWEFEPHKLQEEELLAASIILFETVLSISGMALDVGVSLDNLSCFLHHLQGVYRRQPAYHNFQHAVDVLQATHRFLCQAGVVPPVSILLTEDRAWTPNLSDSSKGLLSCLDNEDIFVLYVVAIGHDAGHPGFTNMFMKNAQSPLSAVYDHKSALEQMHYAFLLKIMRYHGMGRLLDRPITGPLFRKLLLETVLATDMSVHYDFMKDFQTLLDGKGGEAFNRKIVVSRAVIKCADISNPCRPMGVAQHWAGALMQEWACQTQLEKQLDLAPSLPSLHPSEGPLKEALTQICFIDNYAKPLFDLVSSGIPQMACFSQQCANNRRSWEIRRDEAIAAANDGAAISDPEVSERASECFLTAFPLTLPPSLLPEAEHNESLSVIDDHSSSSASEGAPSLESQTSSPTRFHIQLPSIPSINYPSSPSATPSDTASSTTFPMSDSSISLLHPQPASVSGHTNYSFSEKESTASMRAAVAASVRKKKSFHRNSWNPESFAAFPSFPTSKPSAVQPDSDSVDSTPSKKTELLSALSAPPVPEPPRSAIVESSSTSKRSLLLVLGIFGGLLLHLFISS
ncbi:hypothetical protein JAAARDRAFT_57566 [Jaapia argillacea MUCL 33604]|uniref:PDEase domain-containing protein n=1 Tax=Jaapia argillacea MUCL 33604 TaxID=933084 RepID=A0A067PV24_9AGAM|nr:hypothetical protein JAAARDRAFT_57566 [Jaapia argillacea MUCL 33604]